MAIGAVIGGVSALYGAIQGSRSASTSNSLSKQALELSEAELEFAKERYNRWKSIYGPIEENLGDFFFQLTPEEFSAQGLEAFQKEYQNSQEQLTEFFAVNGIDSGVQADVLAKSGNEAARTKAKIRQNAKFEVANAQQGFLALGTNKESSAVNARQNATNSLTGVLTQQAGIAANSANAGFQAANTGLQTVADYFEQRASEGDADVSGGN